MPTQAIAGFNAALWICAEGNSTTFKKIGEARDATISISQNEIEATSFQSGGWSEYIPGLKEWSVDIEALYIPDDIAQEDLYDSLIIGKKINIRLQPKYGVGQIGYTGDVFVSSWEINPTPDDVISVSVSLRGTGTLYTYTAVSSQV